MSVLKSMQLIDYAKESYDQFKSKSAFFDTIMCALIHSENVSNIKELTNVVRNCQDNASRNKVTETKIRALIEEFGNKTLLTFGIKDGKTITHHPTKLGELVISLYRKDKSIENKHS